MASSWPTRCMAWSSPVRLHRITSRSRMSARLSGCVRDNGGWRSVQPEIRHHVADNAQEHHPQHGIFRRQASHGRSRPAGLTAAWPGTGQPATPARRPAASRLLQLLPGRQPAALAHPAQQLAEKVNAAFLTRTRSLATGRTAFRIRRSRVKCRNTGNIMARPPDKSGQRNGAIRRRCRSYPHPITLRITIIPISSIITPAAIIFCPAGSVRAGARISG